MPSFNNSVYILSVKSCSIWVLVALFDHHQGMSACTAALKIDVFSPKLKGVCIALHSSTSPGAHLGKSQTGGIKIVEKFSKFFPFALKNFLKPAMFCHLAVLIGFKLKDPR